MQGEGTARRWVSPVRDRYVASEGASIAMPAIVGRHAFLAGNNIAAWFSARRRRLLLVSGNYYPGHYIDDTYAAAYRTLGAWKYRWTICGCFWVMRRYVRTLPTSSPWSWARRRPTAFALTS